MMANAPPSAAPLAWSAHHCPSRWVESPYRCSSAIALIERKRQLDELQEKEEREGGAENGAWLFPSVADDGTDDGTDFAEAEMRAGCEKTDQEGPAGDRAEHVRTPA